MESLTTFLLRLNILVLGGENGSVELYAYGMYKIATLTEVSLFFSFDIRAFYTSLSRFTASVL